MKYKKPILYDIKISTGISIVLVVIGHLALRGETGIDFYVSLKTIIYKFHMPLFLFLSGSIAYYTYEPIKSCFNYFDYIKKKIFRILPAYIILSLIFFIAKSNLYEIDNYQSFINFLFYPAEGNSGFLWYLYVLFMYYLIMPALYYLVNTKFWLFFTISFFVSSFFTFPKIFSLNFFFWYLPFFTLGCYLILKRKKFILFLSKYGLIFLFLFLIFTIIEFTHHLNIPKNFISIFSIIGISYFSSIVVKRNSFFEKLGDNSFYIYLFNSLFIGGITVIIVKYMGKIFFLNNFYFIAPILIVAGVLFPILLHKFFIIKVPILRNLIK